MIKEVSSSDPAHTQPLKSTQLELLSGTSTHTLDKFTEGWLCLPLYIVYTGWRADWRRWGKSVRQEGERVIKPHDTMPFCRIRGTENGEG